jgi:thiamine-phosphate pyrophosphorylase
VRLPHPPLLVVTDRSQARHPLVDTLAAAFAAGCRWASLREKDLPPGEQIALMRELLSLARRYGAAVTLHGFPELAGEAGADGVHLTAGSDAAAARRLLGAGALIGISVHHTGEAARLDPAIIDYAVAGPAFETASKPGYGPALGSAGIAAITSAAGVPIIAIGGIDRNNAAELLAAGATGLAVMGGIMHASDPATECRLLLRALRSGE